jgi:hypothetical protein
MRIFGGDRWKLPLFDAFAERPLRISGDVEAMQEILLRGAARPSELFSAATSRLGLGVRRGLVGDPVEEIRQSLSPKDPLPTALGSLWRQSGIPISPEEAEGSGSAPHASRFAESLALVVSAASRTIAARGTAFTQIAGTASRRMAGVGKPLQSAREAAGSSARIDPSDLQRDAIAYVIDPMQESSRFSRRRGISGMIDYPVWNAATTSSLPSNESSSPAKTGPSREAWDPSWKTRHSVRSP